MRQQVTTRVLFAVVAFALSLPPLVRAQTREITINDTGVRSENLTSSQEGAVYFGSMAKGRSTAADLADARGLNDQRQHRLA